MTEFVPPICDTIYAQVLVLSKKNTRINQENIKITILNIKTKKITARASKIRCMVVRCN